MDDEDPIRRILTLMLGRLGYDVTCVPSGEQAVAEYAAAKQSGRPFSAIILDLTIANGMGGLETFRTIREADPQVRAIVSSGHTRDPSVVAYREAGFLSVLPKPFRLDDVVNALKQALGDTHP